MEERQGTGRWLLLQMGVAAALAAAAATLVSFRIPPQYQARVQLLALTRGEPASGAGPVDFFNTVVVRFDPRASTPSATAALDYMIPKSLPLPDYKLLFMNTEMGTLLRDWLTERSGAAGLPTEGLTAESVLRQMEVRTRVLLQTQNELRYQHVVELLFSAETPGLAAGAANAWAGWCVEAANNKRMDDTTELLALATSQCAAAQTARDKAAQALETLRQAGGADRLTKQAASLEAVQTENEIRLIALKQAIASAEAQLASWQAAQQAGLAEAPAKIQEIQATLAGLRAEQQALPEANAALQQAATAARAQWAKAQREEDQLQLDIQTLNKSVEDLTQCVTAAKMAAEQTLPDFKIAAKALPPNEKTSPHRGLLVMTAALLGAAALPLVRLGHTAVRRCMREMDAMGT